VADIVEDVKFRFGTEVGGVSDAGALQVFLGKFGDLARIAVVDFACDGVFDVAGDVEGGNIEEGIHVGRVRIGDQQHVRFVDGLEAANGGAVEGQAVGKNVFIEKGGRNGKVLHLTGQVGKADIYDLRLFLYRKVNHVFGRHGTLVSFWKISEFS